jgi:hypothetical protein
MALNGANWRFVGGSPSLISTGINEFRSNPVSDGTLIGWRSFAPNGDLVPVPCTRSLGRFNNGPPVAQARHSAAGEHPAWRSPRVRAVTERAFPRADTFRWAAAQTTSTRGWSGNS